MPRDKTATHVRVLEAARAEFMAHGFERASMRRIGARCGITAAGLYRHCTNKEELFEQVVAPSVQKIHDWIEGHIQRSYQQLEKDTVTDLWKDSEMDMMRTLIYPNMEAYRLLFTKAEGSAYATFWHDLIEQYQSQFLDFLPLLRAKGYPVMEIDPKAMFLLWNAYTSAMLGPVIHGYTQEEAFRCFDILEAFFLPAWQRILGYEGP